MNGGVNPISMKATAATDEEIRELVCATCGKEARCVGRYEDMPEPGEPACDACCGHACEDGTCEDILDWDGDIDEKCRRRCDMIIATQRRAREAN